MKEKIVSIVFCIILVGFFALVVVMPHDEQASVQENRPLAQMPEVSANNIFFGTFTTDFEAYLTDNVAFRTKFVELGNKIEKMRGIQPKDTGIIVDLPSGTKLVLNDGKIMEVYKENPEAMKQYIDALNGYSEKFSDKSDLYVMIAPTQIEFDTSKYRALADSERATIDEVYSSLNNFKTVNVYDKLKANRGEYIYFRTDHHWTQRGAYYGYRSIMEAKGEDYVELKDMTMGKYSGFLGYLYNQANVREYSAYADEIEYFENGENYIVYAKGKDAEGKPVDYQASIYTPPAPDTAPTYGIFMGGDHDFAEINTNNKNGEVALVIKDSYANTVIPLLTNNYETILVVDPRSFGGTVTELYNQYEIDDIIFINYALSTTFPTISESIANIME
ncbi:MAG: hypothetical protein IJB70_00635 [Clostridia bacterium]|nr:hypothetical protein [Clostridia bacterium]